MVSDPVRKGWWGYGLVFDRIYRINRIEGDGRRNAEGAGITLRARRGKRTLIGGKATLTLRQCGAEPS